MYLGLARLAIGLGTRGHPPEPPPSQGGEINRTFPPCEGGVKRGWIVSAATRAQFNREAL